MGYLCDPKMPFFHLLKYEVDEHCIVLISTVLEMTYLSGQQFRCHMCYIKSTPITAQQTGFTAVV